MAASMTGRAVITQKIRAPLGQNGENPNGVTGAYLLSTVLAWRCEPS